MKCYFLYRMCAINIIIMKRYCLYRTCIIIIIIIIISTK